jgi:hypothetical protein
LPSSFGLFAGIHWTVPLRVKWYPAGKWESDQY